MAALHFEFAVDSDVYPELHAALAAIGSDESRGERIRQLAAAGLLWEAARIRGASVIGIGAAPSNAAYAELAPAPRSSVRTRARIAARAAERRAPALPDAGDLVEHAADAAPAAEPCDFDSPGSLTRDRQPDAAAAPHIPVLIDVVRFGSPSATSGANASATHRAAAAAASVRSFMQAVEALPPQSDLPASAGNADEPTDESIDEQGGVLAPVAILMHKPATRSRLQRMKEKGLFRNG